MKTIKIYFVLIVYFLALVSISSQSDTIELKKFAAIDTFNLNYYVLPDLKYKSLSFGFDLFTNSDDSRRNTSGSSGKAKFSRFNFESNIDLFQYFYFNSPKKQLSGWDYFNFDIEYKKLKDWDSSVTSKKWNLRPSFSSNRSYKFFNSKNYFFELTSHFSGIFGGYKYFDFSMIDGTTIHIYPFEKNSYNLDFRPGIGIGKGRIEDVTDAWQTIRILKDLEREKLLTDIPNSDQILSITKRISEIKNERIFDSRIRSKENLKRLDEALFNTGLISNRNIEYYNSLFDMWFYGINFRRLTNWDIALHFTPEISIWDNDYKEKNTNEGLRSGFSAGISYSNYRPVNMFWQFDINASVDFNYIYDDYFTNNNSIDKKGYLSPYLGAKLTNFISTRAYFSTSLINQFNYLIYENSNKPISYSYYVSSKNNFVYYLSPATILNVNLDFGYSLNKHDNDFYSNFQNGFGHTFKIGFNHYFY